MVRPLSLLLVSSIWTCCAADVGLERLRASLVSLRDKPMDSKGPRGATPRLTVVKHELRDWAESQMRSLTERGDQDDFQRRLNSDLRAAGLFCSCEGAKGVQRCPDWSMSGFLGVLKVRRASGFLIVQSAIGIECGYDESAYIYSWSEKGWRRVWQNEQNNYARRSTRLKLSKRCRSRPSTGQMTILCSPWERNPGARQICIACIIASSA
jgi:hypothetical protein